MRLFCLSCCCRIFPLCRTRRSRTLASALTLWIRRWPPRSTQTCRRSPTTPGCLFRRLAESPACCQHCGQGCMETRRPPLRFFSDSSQKSLPPRCVPISNAVSALLFQTDLQFSPPGFLGAAFPKSRRGLPVSGMTRFSSPMGIRLLLLRCRPRRKQGLVTAPAPTRASPRPLRPS